MNKAQLVEKMAQTAGITKTAADDALNALIHTVTAALKKGQKVTITGFGSFERRARAARNGVNPATGKAIKIKATKVPAFKAGKAFKDEIKASK